MLQNLLHGDGLAQIEARRLGAPQGGHDPTAAQCRADVMAQGADIGALGAADPQQKVMLSGLLQHLQTKNGHRPGLALHGLALSGQLIEFFAVPLQGGVHGGHLQNIPGELGQHFLQLRQPRRHRVLLQHRARHVLGVGDLAEMQGGDVLLFPVLGKLHRPGGPAYKHRQHPGGQGIQSAGVAHPALPHDPAQLGAHIHAGPVLGFVHNDNAAGHSYAPSRPWTARMAANTLALASCSSTSNMLAPAAAA